MPASLSDAFEAHPVHIHVKQIDLDSVKELPDSYAWKPLDHFPSGDSLKSSESVPVIDLTDPNAMKLVGRACKTWGAFQITNHGIPTSLLHKIECQSKSLFTLPPEQKLKAARPPNAMSGYGLPRISSFFSKLMWYEGFTIVGSPLEHARQLWPNDYIQFCDVVDEYEKEMKKLGGILMWLMLGSLGITKDDVKWVESKSEFSEACAAIQLNSYPTCPDPERAMGLAPHTDSTLFTILYQNSTSGLQVLREGIGWVTVPPIPGALVVNVGDLLQILSNGSYLSVLHRAMVNSKKHRLSVAYLYGPPRSVQISPLSKLVDPIHPPLYRSITWSEYLNTKAKLFNNTLLSVRILVL